MAGTIQVDAASARVAEVFPDLLAAVRGVIQKHRIRFDEYRQAIGFLMEAGRSEYELPLLLDVFLAVTVDDVNNPSIGSATESNVEGPFYIPGAPELERPYALPVRDNEPGDVLFLSGSARSLDGAPIPGVLLDIWQANGEGGYSHFDPSQPEYNLRGKVRSDAQGRFEVRTVVPAAYEIPKQGPTGRLVEALGGHCFRPAHIHAMVSNEGYPTEVNVGSGGVVDLPPAQLGNPVNAFGPSGVGVQASEELQVQATRCPVRQTVPDGGRHYPL